MPEQAHAWRACNLHWKKLVEQFKLTQYIGALRRGERRDRGQSGKSSVYYLALSTNIVLSTNTALSAN